MNAKNTTRSLGLRIPSCDPGVTASFLTDAEEMADWIAALPLANIGETGRHVYSALLDFNRNEVPPADRLKIAERLRQPLHYVLSNLKKHYLDIGLPLSPKGRKIAALGQEMHAEMALPYKIVIEQTVAGRKHLGREALALAVFRAMQHLCEVLLQSALTYSPTPQNVWQELHRLYAFAAQNQLEALSVTEPETGAAHTISALYKRILLFTLANPTSMRQGENLYLYQNLMHWATHAHLRPPQDKEDEAEEFIVQLPSDRPPSHIRLQNQQPGENCLVLDTKELVAYLRARAAELPPTQKTLKPGQDGHVLSQSFLKRLIKAWGSAPNRTAVRTRQSFDLKVAVGLPTVHSLLKKDQEEHRKKLSRRELADIDWLQHQVALDQAFGGANHAVDAHPPQELVFSVNPGAGNEAKKGYTPTIVGTTLRADNPAPWADEKARKVHAALPRKTLNESAGGFCISWLGPDATKVRVGELIGIQSSANPHQYSAGAIRWMKEANDQELQLGVQVLASQCQAVNIYHRDDAQHKEAKACLLLPSTGSPGGSASLITPTFLYDVGETLLLEDEDGDHLVQLGALQESTGAFACFDFSYVAAKDTAETKEEAAETAEESKPRSSYDSIWDML